MINEDETTDILLHFATTLLEIASDDNVETSERALNLLYNRKLLEEYATQAAPVLIRVMQRVSTFKLVQNMVCAPPGEILKRSDILKAVYRLLLTDLDIRMKYNALHTISNLKYFVRDAPSRIRILDTTFTSNELLNIVMAGGVQSVLQGRPHDNQFWKFICTMLNPKRSKHLLRSLMNYEGDIGASRKLPDCATNPLCELVEIGPDWDTRSLALTLLFDNFPEHNQAEVLLNASIRSESWMMRAVAAHFGRMKEATDLEPFVNAIASQKDELRRMWSFPPYLSELRGLRRPRDED